MWILFIYLCKIIFYISFLCVAIFDSLYNEFDFTLVLIIAITYSFIYNPVFAIIGLVLLFIFNHLKYIGEGDIFFLCLILGIHISIIKFILFACLISLFYIDINNFKQQSIPFIFPCFLSMLIVQYNLI